MIKNAKLHKEERQKIKSRNHLQIKIKENMDMIKDVDSQFDDIVQLLKKRKGTSIKPNELYDKRAANFVYAEKTKPTVNFGIN